MDLALYCLNFPEIMTSQPLAPSIITPLMTELAAILTGTDERSLNLHYSAWAEAQSPNDIKFWATFLSNFNDVQFNWVFGVVESLLDEGSEFSDLSSIDSQNFLDLGGFDSDFGLDGGNSNFDSGVSGRG